MRPIVAPTISKPLFANLPTRSQTHVKSDWLLFSLGIIKLHTKKPIKRIPERIHSRRKLENARVDFLNPLLSEVDQEVMFTVSF